MPTLRNLLTLQAREGASRDECSKLELLVRLATAPEHRRPAYAISREDATVALAGDGAGDGAGPGGAARRESNAAPARSRVESH